MLQGEPQNYTQGKVAEELLFVPAAPFQVKLFGEIHRTSAEPVLGSVRVGTQPQSPGLNTPISAARPHKDWT